MKRNFFSAIVLLLVLVSCTQQTSYRVEPILVETETVSAGVTDAASGRTYVGTVEEEEAVSVSFTTMGTLRRVLVSEGQTVSSGQLLAEIDDTQARNMLDAAKASCHQAEDAIGRYKQLYEKGSLAEAKWIEAQSRLEEARASLRAAEKNLQECRLIAPTSGIVGRKQLTSGSTALPSQPVVTLYKINNVKVKVAVPEREMAQIGADTPSHIEVPAAGITLDGGRIEKGVVADGMTHTYDIRISCKNTDHRLLPGMVCNVVLTPNSSLLTPNSSLLTLPVRCVQQSASGEHFVWVVDAEQTAHRQAVTLGQVVGNRIEILSGLTTGTRVITAGYQKVSEGQQVTLN